MVKAFLLGRREERPALLVGPAPESDSLLPPDFPQLGNPQESAESPLAPEALGTVEYVMDRLAGDLFSLPVGRHDVVTLDDVTELGARAILLRDLGELIPKPTPQIPGAPDGAELLVGQVHRACRRWSSDLAGIRPRRQPCCSGEVRDSRYQCSW